MNMNTLTMPRLGETMEHGVVATWLIDTGKAFKRGDPIIEFETDKTAVEYPALGAGVLVEQLVQAGYQVQVGAPIALIDIGEGSDWVSDTTDALGEADDSAPSVDEDSERKTDDSAAIEQSLHSVSAAQALSPRATPAARKLARASGVQLAEVLGTGRRGRIETHDVQTHAEALPPKISLGSHRSSLAGSETDNVLADLQFTDGIAYRATGPKTGRPYLLVHGFAGENTAWTLLSCILVKAGCRVIIVDLPGHGATRTEAKNTAALSAGLVAVIKANNPEATLAYSSALAGSHPSARSGPGTPERE